MSEGERRKLVFVNLANGVPPEAIMEALKISRLDLDRDFAFVKRKIRSYRFERQMPVVPCETFADVRANRVELLFSLSRINLATDPKYSRIETLPFDPSAGGPSIAEQRLFEMRMRAASGGKR